MGENPDVADRTFKGPHRLLWDPAENRGLSPQKTHTCMDTPSAAFEDKGLWTPPTPSLSLGPSRSSWPPDRGALAQERTLQPSRILGEDPSRAALAPDFQSLSRCRGGHGCSFGDGWLTGCSYSFRHPLALGSPSSANTSCARHARIEEQNGRGRGTELEAAEKFRF